MIESQAILAYSGAVRYRYLSTHANSRLETEADECRLDLVRKIRI